ncbi:MAG: hypothetical protein LQ344_007787 [Seirophora lacunosa]|nr:MAG: hypothetical protein LQ344_007787 [Seirophora lacunosa]
MEPERQALDIKVRELEAKTGMSGHVFDESQRAAAHEHTAVLKDLHVCEGLLAFFERTTQFQVGWIEWLQVQQATLNQLRFGTRELLSLPPANRQMEEIVASSLGLCASLSKERLEQVRTLRNRIRIQLSVVANSMTQNDGRTNIAIAEASRRIAFETKRDSDAMKTIAALTMAFLPATFVAVSVSNMNSMRFLCLSANVGALFLTCRSMAHFSLTQLQPIAGFSEACTQAYETTFDECTLSDFYEGSVCSAQCVAYLEAMTTLLNDKCRGITASPNTLIGLFFKKTAIEELCPDVDVTTVTVANPEQSSTPPQAEPTPPSTALPSEVSVEVISTTTSLVTSTTVASSIISSRTATSPRSTTTSADSASSVTSASPGLGAGSTSSPTENDTTSTGAATSTGAQRAQPQPTSESQNDSGAINNGNGGTVLDAASAAGSGFVSMSWLWPVSAGLAAAAWSF